MRHRFFTSLTLLFVAGLWAASPALAADTKVHSGKTWVAPKTPDGQPDLQGTWTNATITPFERPDDVADKAVLSPEEAAELRSGQPTMCGSPAETGRRRQLQSGLVRLRHQSDGHSADPLVVDPPDGRVPVNAAAVPSGTMMSRTSPIRRST